MALNPADACGLADQSIPQWKRELIIRRRALGRTLHVGNSSVKLTCPAVVALVRQPETLNSSENITICKQQRSSTSEEFSTCSSLNQNRVNFHPSTSSADSVSNMRLLDTCSDVNNLVINGIDVKNKQSDVVSSDACVNYNLIMGEDKSVNLKKKNAISRPKLEQNSSSVNKQHKVLLAVDQISSEGTNGIPRPIKDEDCLSDSSEELQYGPGIVNKLKTKYLSMTLREHKRNIRPSIANLRRATSLENMLDGEANLNNQNKPVKDNSGQTGNLKINHKTMYSDKSVGLSSHCTMKHLGNRSLETMKRARSMDTLLKSESRTAIRNNFSSNNRHISKNELSVASGKPIASIINENVIIVENVPIGINDSCRQDAVKDPTHPKRITKMSENRDLPPPDLVKQTLKIFETSPKKKAKPPNQTNLAKLVAGFSNSSSQPVSSVGSSNKMVVDKSRHNSKPILSPKPVLSPEKLRQNRTRISSPKKSSSNNNSLPINKPSVRSPTNVSKNTDKQLRLDILEPSITQKPDKTIGVTSPQSISPVVTVIANNEQISPIPTTQNQSKLSTNKHKTEEINNRLLDLDDFDVVDVNNCSKPVPESALENIRRGGISMQFSFKNENSQNPPVSKPYLPRPKSPPQAVNATLLQEQFEKPPQTVNISPLRSQSLSHTKQVGIIRPIVTSKIQSSHSSPALTDQEIEKNLINRVKSIDQPISKVVVAIKALPDNVVLGSVSSDVVTNKNLSLPRVFSNSKVKAQGLWDDKLWQQNQNTIVFNFSDRKEVPDYIENDGLILRGKRERPRPGEGGIILLDSAAESSTDPDDPGYISDPPSPCDVTFEGGNVLINGKSNLKKSPKLVKLRIKFNDEATTMFEYPSEASLAEEDSAAQPSDSSAASASASEESSSSQSTSSQPAPGLPLALGGSLGAYTPRQVAAGDWQLGVTPVVSPTPAPTTSTEPRDDNHLKPAPPESTMAWSEDTASDLLF